MAARLVHEGYDTSRMYEWTWIEREKDHRGVDDRVIGLLPITPFSTLAVWPIAGLEAADGEACVDCVQPAAADSDGVDAAADDEAELRADCAGACAVVSFVSQPALWAVLCAAAVDDCVRVLVLAARMAGRGRCAGGRGGRLQGVSGAAAGVVFAKAAVARAGGWLDCRRGVRGDFGRGVWRGGESNVAGGDSAVGDARRGPGHVCGGCGVDLGGVAWASAGRAAVESASVA